MTGCEDDCETVKDVSDDGNHVWDLEESEDSCSLAALSAK